MATSRSAHPTQAFTVAFPLHPQLFDGLCGLQGDASTQGQHDSLVGPGCQRAHVRRRQAVACLCILVVAATAAALGVAVIRCALHLHFARHIFRRAAHIVSSVRGRFFKRRAQAPSPAPVVQPHVRRAAIYHPNRTSVTLLCAAKCNSSIRRAGWISLSCLPASSSLERTPMTPSPLLAPPHQASSLAFTHHPLATLSNSLLSHCPQRSTLKAPRFISSASPTATQPATPHFAAISLPAH